VSQKLVKQLRAAPSLVPRRRAERLGQPVANGYVTAISSTRTQPVTNALVDAMSPSASARGEPSRTCSSAGLRVQVRAAAVTKTPWSVPAAAPMTASQTWYLMALSKSK